MLWTKQLYQFVYVIFVSMILTTKENILNGTLYAWISLNHYENTQCINYSYHLCDF